MITRDLMDKTALCATIVSQLKDAVKHALAAVDQAHATATDKQNIAENKYDTLGLEAAYLAHGQSERVVQLTKAIKDFGELSQNIQPHDQIQVGSLVRLEDESGSFRHVFMGPSAGGDLVIFNNITITVITLSSPLGQSLLSRTKDDEVAADIAGKTIHYLITELW